MQRSRHLAQAKDCQAHGCAQESVLGEGLPEEEMLAAEDALRAPLY